MKTNLIGISGRISSGKDTVGSIIQYLTDKNVTTETFEFWHASNFYSVYQATGVFQVKKFAGKLKLIGSILSGIAADQFEDQEFKKLYMGIDWDMTYREFLQRLGTDAMRDNLHINVWVNALFADYKEEIYRTAVPTRAAGFIDQYMYPNWIITDMRFPNEMEAVEQRKGITIRVVRSFNHKMGSKETGTLDLTPLHPSETALDDAEFDYTIVNDSTIEDLVEKVKQILIKEQIL